MSLKAKNNNNKRLRGFRVIFIFINITFASLSLKSRKLKDESNDILVFFFIVILLYLLSGVYDFI
jgi:amino acid permease